MDGVLLFDKPYGWTSHDAVDFVRRIARQRQVGHAGTLDPRATGLLVLLLGKATKLSQLLSGAVKGYDGTMRLGMTTDTYDLEGKTLSTAPASSITTEDLKAAFKEWVGEREQVPPMYSAVKQGGKKLYELARQGVSVDVKPRPIVIDRFELTRFETPEAYFSLTCSKGTYVRSLCDAIGKKLGCGAVLSSLVRTRSGNFFLKDAASEEGLKNASAEQLAAKVIPYENIPRA